MVDDPEEHSFVFMLASHTHTVNVEMLRSLGAECDALSEYLEKTEFKMNTFKNIGSIAIYS